MNQQAPYMRAKDFDHEDVDYEFTSDRTLAWIANILASLGIFCLLMVAIGVVAQIPESWFAWLVLNAWGV
jgi:hypothetical protein